MTEEISNRTELLELLRRKSLFRGSFVLSSGGTSSYYIDCRLTTFDPLGARMIGEAMCQLICAEARRRRLTIDAIGGLTLGADPVALASGIYSVSDPAMMPLQVFSVRKNPKEHGQARLIEGNFKKGDTVVVVDDVVTRGASTLKAIENVRQEGGQVAFAAVLVDRQEGGRQRIEETGVPVVVLYTRDQLLGESTAGPDL